jgi:hypothetical protein
MAIRDRAALSGIFVQTGIDMNQILPIIQQSQYLSMAISIS